MKSNIKRLQLIFLGLFVVASISVFAYHYIWVWPKARCDARGGVRVHGQLQHAVAFSSSRFGAVA